MKAIELDPQKRAFRLWAEQNAIRGLLSAGQLPEALAMISACAYCWGTFRDSDGNPCAECREGRESIEKVVGTEAANWPLLNEARDTFMKVKKDDLLKGRVILADFDGEQGRKKNAGNN